MLTTLLLANLAFAQDPEAVSPASPEPPSEVPVDFEVWPPPDAEPEEPAGAPAAQAEEPTTALEPEEPDYTAFTVDQLIEEAVDRRRRSDHAGSRIVLEQALARASTGREQVEIRYHLAIAWELEGEHGTAIALYDEVNTGWPESHRASDIRFRRAEALANSGHASEALDNFGDFGPLPPEDARRVALMEAMFHLQAGHRRKGRKRIAATLADMPAGEAMFYQAKARALLAEDFIAEASERSLDTRKRKQRRNLQRRAELLAAAEQQVIAIAQAEEVEWVLHGMFHLGLGYEQLGDALLTARAPRLSDDQLTVFNAEIARNVETVWVKSAAYYQKGLDVALRTQWGSRRQEWLRDGHAGVMSKVEAL